MDNTLTARVLKIPGWLSKREGWLLYTLAKDRRTSGEIVEIGSFQGKSTVFLGLGNKENPQPEKIFSVDPHNGETHAGRKEFKNTLTAFKKNLADFGVSKYTTIVRNTSERAVKNWGKPISLLNIDGLHEYSYVKKDLQNWLRYLENGGIVVCHDAFTPEPGVFRAVHEEIFDSPNFSYLGVVDSQIFAVRGKRKNILEKVNFLRTKWALIASESIWQNASLHYTLRFFIVNRLLKVFFLNKYFIRAILGRFNQQ